MKASFVLARSVNGQCLDTLGTLTLGVRLGKELLQHDFQVVRGAHYPVILGWDFLEKHHALLDIRNKTVLLWNMRLPLLPKGHEVAACCNVSVLAPAKLPAMSETIITACVSGATAASPVPTDYVGILVPNPTCDVVVAHSLSEVQNGMTVVRVLNTTENDIELLPGQHLGEFHSTSSNNTTIVEEACCMTSTVHSDAVPPVQMDETNLSHSQAQSLKMLLRKYSTVFSMHSEDRGRTGIIKHRIRTGDATPIKQRAYRVTPEQRAEIQNQVDELLKADIIEESYSPWAAPVILVRKKDGTWRFCLDYRKLNAVTIKDSHPLPRVDDALDALSGSAWFSTMDLQHGYWQVEVEEQDREKTAFTTGSGLYHFKVLPMGLTNAPATFLRLMEMVLRGLPWKTCLVYLDDVLIFSRSFSDHLQHLEEVFSRLRATGLKLNPAKCCLAKDHVQFLGHVVSKDGIQPDPRNVQCVADWPTPHTPTEVRAFLGLCSYYRKFIRNFARHAVPLHALTEKNVPFQWTSQCQDAFTYLKHVLSNPPVVAFPDFSLPFFLYTDASCSAIGAVLAQKHSNHENVVAYASHVLTKAERRWSTYDRELWAIVWAVRHFRHYLYKQPFVIITDHKPLVGLRKIPIDNDRTGRRARWALELDSFEWTVLYREGQSHSNADALSRRPDVNRPAEHITSTQAFSSKVIKGESDPVTQSSPVSTPQHGNCHSTDFKPVDGTITLNTPQLLRPASQCSSEITSSTFVLQLTEDELREKQHQDPFLSEVMSWKARGQRPLYWRMKKRSPVERAFWQEYHRLTFNNGVLCRKKSTAHPLVPDQRSTTVAKCLFENYIREHGIPEILHTDQGRQFESDLIRHLCKLLGVQKTRTSPYHPQGDGMVERFNRTLIDQLAKSLLQQPCEWDDCLNQVALAYNTCPHGTTGFSPFFLTHGREARMPANLLLPNNIPSTSTPGSPADYAAQLTRKLQLAFQSAAQNRDYAHSQQKHYYDKLVKHIPYNPGDLVWLNDPTTTKHKLAPHWKGPFEILECLGSDDDNPGVTYRIRYLLHQSDKSQIVHYNRLKPYLSPVPAEGCDTTAFDLHKQPQLPCLTALSGALPFTHSKSPSTRDLNVPADSQVPLSSQTCSPQVQTPLTQASAVDPQEHLLVDQSPTFPPAAMGHSSDFSVRPGRRQVKLPSYLMDYVLT
ncbi:hypothetical protein MHYP_G00351310 [Metynnis hypsauchen]